MTRATPSTRTGRTKLITLGSIAAVAIAGAIAIGANIGILNAAGDNTVGTLSAAGDLSAPGAPPPSDAVVQEFSVDVAGTVSLSASGGGLGLDRVVAADGWTWTLAQTRVTALTVTFTNGTRTLDFLALLSADGTIAANVDEPVTGAVLPDTTPGTTPGTTVGGDDGHVGTEYEYEGGGDDD